MDIFEVIFLGIVQGITEFLPISSSGHIVVVQNFFQLSSPTLIFNVSLHVGTLVAVIIVLRKDMILIVSTIFNFPKIIKEHGNIKESYTKNEEVRLLVLLIGGSIPTAIVGFVFQSFYEFFLGSTICVSLMLLLSGSFLHSTKNLISTKRKTILQIKIRDSIIIGIMQGLAVVPGISRSGITISTGLILGMEHDLAGRFSFLLSVPAILGAFILSLYSSQDLQMILINPKLVIIGAFVSIITGYIALKLALSITKSKHIHIFAPYCYLIGLLLLITT